MTQKLTVTGMTCEACEYKIKHVFSEIEGVKNVIANHKDNTVTVEMDKPISLESFKEVLKPFPKYSVENYKGTAFTTTFEEEKPRTWLETYTPILLIFSYITGVSFLIEFQNESFNLMPFMQHFMAGFFLVFSFFKLLNLKGFAESYAMYDVVAKEIPAWGYMYAFIELFLGIAYLINFNPFITNLTTFLVMSISIIGVLKSVMNKQKIQCACLGAVFNLPMSTVTIIEDLLMILMSGFMLLMH